LVVLFVPSLSCFIRKVVEEEVIGEEVDYNKKQGNPTEGSTEEESWIQEGESE